MHYSKLKGNTKNLSNFPRNYNAHDLFPQLKYIVSYDNSDFQKELFDEY